MRFRFLLKLLVAFVLGGLFAVAVDAQPALTDVTAKADSILLETCRGGTLSTSLTCSGATASPRVTVLRRLAAWIKATNGSTGPVLSVSYASQIPGWSAEGVDTVTVCARVHRADHSERVGWPPLRLTLLRDSATATVRGGNPLSQMCAALGLSAKDSVPVTWAWSWVTIDGKRLWRPAFAVP